MKQGVVSRARPTHRKGVQSDGDGVLCQTHQQSDGDGTDEVQDYAADAQRAAVDGNDS